MCFSLSVSTKQSNFSFRTRRITSVNALFVPSSVESVGLERPTHLRLPSSPHSVYHGTSAAERYPSPPRRKNASRLNNVPHIDASKPDYGSRDDSERVRKREKEKKRTSHKLRRGWGRPPPRRLRASVHDYTLFIFTFFFFLCTLRKARLNAGCSARCAFSSFKDVLRERRVVATAGKQNGSPFVKPSCFFFIIIIILPTQGLL